MGFYLRKSFSLAKLLRLNLSRSGLGVSVGAPGARIGVGPRGSYFHVGRGGLYYRQNLSGGGGRRQPIVLESHALPEVESAPISSLYDASSEDLLAELNRVQQRTALLPFAFLTLLAAMIGWGYLVLSVQAPPPKPTAVAVEHPLDGQSTAEVLRERYATEVLGLPNPIRKHASLPPWLVFGTLGSLIVLGFLLAAWARQRDVKYGTATINYALVDEDAKWFKDLEKAFIAFSACEKVWHIIAQGATDDWKRNAGAKTLVTRQGVVPSLELPTRVQSNITPLALPAGRQKLYFFPDRLLVYESGAVGAVSYSTIHAAPGSSRFVETENVPGDAEVVDHTWRFVAKSGGPDRRFSNNAQIPVLRYGQLHLTSEAGLNELFQFSKPDAADNLARALNSRRLRAEGADSGGTTAE